MAWLREIDIGSLNLDLMYGLPHQTATNVVSTIDQVMAFKPERLALFGYEHVPWMKSHQKLIEEGRCRGRPSGWSRARSPPNDSRPKATCGSESNFALPDDELAVAQREGRLRRNFQGYTTNLAPSLLGMGVSAIGAPPDGYVQSIAQEVGWRAAIDRGDLPVARGVRVTPEDQFCAEIIERLMCAFSVDLAAVSRRHGHGMESLVGALEQLAPFVADGLVEIGAGRVVVTELGRDLVRSVCACFDAYFDPDAVRPSRTI